MPRQRRDKLNTMPTSNSTPLLTFSGFQDEEELCALQALARTKMNLPVNHTPLCVVHEPVRRTLKVLQAAAAGHFIVGKDWVEAAAGARRSSGGYVNPAPYEKVDGSRTARLAGGGVALRGLEVSVRGETSMPRADLVPLLELSGATVRLGRNSCCSLPCEVHRQGDREKIEGAGEQWLLDRIMAGGGSKPNDEQFEHDEDERRQLQQWPEERQRERQEERQQRRQLQRPQQQLRPDQDAREQENAPPMAEVTVPTPKRQRLPQRPPLPPPLPAPAPLPVPPPADAAAPLLAAKRARRGADGEPTSVASVHPLPAPPTASSNLPIGVEFVLLPARAQDGGDFSPLEASALHLFRSRLPGCNVDLPGACSPRHPGLRERARRSDDFLQLLVDGCGARTAVARKTGADDSVLGACTFIPHPGSSFCELQLLAVRQAQSGKGYGSMLLAHVEHWLQAQGIGTVVALAGNDVISFWEKRGYAIVTPPSSGQRRGAGNGKSNGKVSQQQWALIRDPFGNSSTMHRAITS